MPAVASIVDVFLENFVSQLVYERCAILDHFQIFQSEKPNIFTTERQFKPTTLCHRSRNFLKEITNAKLGFSFTHG